MLEIKKSEINGRGVFTKNKLNKGEKVFKFADKIIMIKHTEECDCHICCRCINLKNNFWLYPYKNSFGWYLNHSCNPNCYSKGKNIYSLKKISKNSEITIDFSTTNIDNKWKMVCHCGSTNCRSIIRSVQYLPRKLFKKHKNYMQPFIKNSYLS